MELLLIFSRTSNERNEIIVVSYAHGSVLNTIVTEYHNLRQQDVTCYLINYKTEQSTKGPSQ